MLPRRLQSDPNLVRLQVSLACGVCACHLASKIARQPVGPNAYDLVRAPFGRRVVERLKLPGQPLGMCSDVVNVCIYTLDEGLSDSLGCLPAARAVSAPLAIHVTAV